MKSCELVMIVSSLACCIAEGRSADELALLSTMFSQLGDSLGVISAQQIICDSKEETVTACCLKP